MVGFSTFQAVVGTKIVPGLLDLYLGKIGYKSQQYNGPHDSDAPNNLYEPVGGDHGARGAFDARSTSRSTYTWLTEHRSALAVAAVLVAGMAAVVVKNDGAK